MSVKESVRDGIQLGDGGESNPRGSPRKGLFPGDEGPATRSKSEDCRSNLGAVPDRSSPTRRHAPEARRPSTIARTRRRSSSVSEPQASISQARLAGSAPDFAPPGSGIVVFPGNLRAGSIPASATVKAGFESLLPRQAR